MQLTEVLREHAGIWLERAGRPPVILDRYARHCFRLPQDCQPDVAEGADDTLTQVAAFFAASPEAPSQPRRRYAVHLLREHLASRELADGLGTLVRAMPPGCVLRVVLHVNDPEQDWSEVLRWAAEVRKNAFSQKFKAWIEVLGRPAALDEPVKEAIFQRAIQLGYTAGWWQGCSPAQYTEFDGQVVRDLAEFGFRIPVIWCAHDGNVRDLMGPIEAALDANLHSGFAVPAVWQNPYYSDEKGEPDLAEQGEAYLRLLADVYRRYPHTDDALAPIAELAELAHCGGWHTADQVATHWNLLARPDSVFAVYRQIPALARPWKACDQVAAMDPAEVHSDLMQFCRREFSPDALPRCAGCQWRYVCGGTDPADPDPTDPNASRLELLCEYRRLFLEAFVWQRLKVEQVSHQQSQQAAVPG